MFGLWSWGMWHTGQLFHRRVGYKYWTRVFLTWCFSVARNTLRILPGFSLLCFCRLHLPMRMYYRLLVHPVWSRVAVSRLGFRRPLSWDCSPMKRVQNIVSTFSTHQKRCCCLSTTDLVALACPFWHHVIDTTRKYSSNIKTCYMCACMYSNMLHYKPYDF